MTELYHDAQRRLQDRFDTRRLADRIEERLVHDFIDEDDAEFILRRDMFFLATVDPMGRPNCSYKGGDPGFVRVIDERTLAFPNYDGNGMYLSMGNALATGEVGMLFIDFEKRNRVRVNGTASVVENDDLIDAYPYAQFIVRVKVREVFPNCPRYIHHYQLVERSRFVPRKTSRPPERSDWACDVLPESDPAREPAAADQPHI
ncbi:MAG: pyridoxamine 5'-phosphate oxidase family protein [Chloroflexi bacterium]|nr:MAG: pyridoxamine 5'-phosphate oxidase family protein [Chloroflexota bacterium]